MESQSERERLDGWTGTRLFWKQQKEWDRQSIAYVYKHNYHIYHVVNLHYYFI